MRWFDLITYGAMPKNSYSYFHSIENEKEIIVCFYENIQEYFNKNKKENVYKYDEYRTTIKTESCEDVDDYILNHYTELFAKAKKGPSALEQIRADVDYILLMEEL